VHLQKRSFTRNKKVFGKFLLSYVLVLLFPLLIGIYAYQQTVHIVREDAVELNRTVLENSKQSLNNLFAEIRDVVSVISLDKDLQALILRADAEWTPESLYQFSLQRNELYKLSTNNYFSDLFVYLRKSETLIASDHIARLYEHPMRIGDQSFGEWLEGVVTREEVNRYHRLEDVTNGKTKGNYIAYVSGLPEGHRTHIDGAAVILIREQSVVQLFNRLAEDDGSFAYILDEHDRLIASTLSGEPPIGAAQLAAEPRPGYQVYEIAGEDTMVSHTRSAYNGWTYVSGLPEAGVFAKAEYIKRINYSILGLALLIGCLAALLLAYRNSKPVQELLESLRELTVKMDEQLPTLRAAFLERLLKTGFNHEDEMRKHLQQARLKLPEQPYVVALLRMYPDQIAMLLPAEPGSGRSAIQPLLDDRERDWLTHELRHATVALIIPLEPGEAEPQLEGIAARLLKLQELLLQTRQSAANAGLGQPASSPLEVWRSYNEARQALDVLDAEITGHVSRYDTLARQSSHYYYPIDLELKLTNTVRAGDVDGLERLLDHIEVENFVQRQLSPWRKMQLLQELQGTLQKLSEQLAHLPLVDAGAALSGDSADSERLVQDMNGLRSVLRSLCEQIGQQKSNRHRKLFEDIRSTIAKRYRDSSLSLCQIATEQKQTESYVSTLFKEQMGITFSDYVEQLRLDEACRLLRETELPIVEIAEQVGYNSDKSFRRAFKRAHGIQPTSFRKAPEAQTDI